MIKNHTKTCGHEKNWEALSIFFLYSCLKKIEEEHQICNNFNLKYIKFLKVFQVHYLFISLVKEKDNRK